MFRRTENSPILSYLEKATVRAGHRTLPPLSRISKKIDKVGESGDGFTGK
jgi:hypothetical protein